MKQIAYITDLHLDEAFPIEHGVDARRNWQLILEDVRSRKIEEIIFGGDIGERTSNAWFFQSLKEFSISITAGNHDQPLEIRKYFNPERVIAGNDLCYAKEDDFYKYLFLDSSAETISDEQLLWFERELRTSKRVVIFIHHPILAVDTPVDRAYPLGKREKLQQALDNCSREVVIFCGHYHMADEKATGTIKQYITPAASYQIRKESEALEVGSSAFGYRIISFHQGQIDTRVLFYHEGSFV